MLTRCLLEAPDFWRLRSNYQQPHKVIRISARARYPRLVQLAQFGALALGASCTSQHQHQCQQHELSTHQRALYLLVRVPGLGLFPPTQTQTRNTGTGTGWLLGPPPMSGGFLAPPPTSYASASASWGTGPSLSAPCRV